MSDVSRPARVLFKPLVSGSWEHHPQMTDYRSEWLSSLLVERALWRHDAAEQRLCDRVVAAPGYVWFRFWLADQGQLVEKYFDDQSQAVGMYLPVCEPLQRFGPEYRTTELVLGLWVDAGRRVSVLREDDFEEAVRRRILSAEEVERAESRVRELTAAIFREELPPPLVRNFEIRVDRD